MADIVPTSTLEQFSGYLALLTALGCLRARSRWEGTPSGRKLGYMGTGRGRSPSYLSASPTCTETHSIRETEMGPRVEFKLLTLNIAIFVCSHLLSLYHPWTNCNSNTMYTLCIYLLYLVVQGADSKLVSTD